LLILNANNNGNLPESVDINKTDNKQLLPINCAAIKGDLEVVKLLIELGHADANI